ncbi:MAG: hypothetical protein U0W24_01835 [Bacteroidales bacterium]
MRINNLKSFFLVSATVFLLLGCSHTSAQKNTMYVDGRYLYDRNGEKVILKGFNAMIVYWDIHGNINFPEMEKTGANCCRIFWNLDYPKPLPSDLDKVLENCIKYKMIPVICLWDATGNWDKLQTCVDYWCSPEITPILQKYEKDLIVNIANEPGDRAMGNEVFKTRYAEIVTQMRTAGIHTPLIIDADQWGRNADAVLDNGPYLLEQDPDHNLIFSWHLWDPENWGTGTKSEIDRIINKAASTSICFIVGEFGPCEKCDNCASTKINWEYMIEKAYKNDIGYLAWVWKWTDCHSIVNNSNGKYGSWANSTWGESIAVTNTYSIQKTSKRTVLLSSENIQNISNDIIIKAFPNPANTKITFQYNLIDDGKFELNIISLSGIKISNLVHEFKKAGTYYLDWVPPHDMKPGFYILSYKLLTKGKILEKSAKFSVAK